LPTYKQLYPSIRPLLLGAGGLSIGSHVTSLLSLGADGAVFGTRFLATEESLVGPLQKQVVIGASAEDSVRSMAFDEARNTLDWPEGVDGRGVRNSTVDDYDRGLGDKTSRQMRYKQAVKEADADRLIV
jgi:nitronate monooxygenase